MSHYKSIFQAQKPSQIDEELNEVIESASSGYCELNYPITNEEVTSIVKQLKKK